LGVTYIEWHYKNIHDQPIRPNENGQVDVPERIVSSSSVPIQANCVGGPQYWEPKTDLLLPSLGSIAVENEWRKQVEAFKQRTKNEDRARKYKARRLQQIRKFMESQTNRDTQNGKPLKTLEEYKELYWHHELQKHQCGDQYIKRNYMNKWSLN
jgi:hypothetical protein